MEDIELSEALCAEYAEEQAEKSDDELVKDIAAAITAGWWKPSNPDLGKLDPSDPPWWWPHAVDGSQVFGTTHAEDEAIMTVTGLFGLLCDIRTDQEPGELEARIARLEKAALANINMRTGDSDSCPVRV